jgi:hypothetical protein
MREKPVKATTSLSVIVPAYNEQHFVVPSLDRLRSLGETPQQTVQSAHPESALDEASM